MESQAQRVLSVKPFVLMIQLSWLPQPLNEAHQHLLGSVCEGNLTVSSPGDTILGRLQIFQEGNPGWQKEASRDSFEGYGPTSLFSLTLTLLPG